LPLRRLLCFTLLAPGMALAACTPFKEDLPGDSGQIESGLPARGVDGSTSDPAGPMDSAGQPDGSPEARACDPNTPFGPPGFVPGFTTLMASLFCGPRLSPDYRTAYFAATAPGGVTYTDLYTATRKDPASSFIDLAPIKAPGINTPLYELEPTVSGDGHTLIFRRNAPDQPAHLYYATRADTSMDFVYAGELPNVNDPAASDQAPFLREDGQVLYFTSNRGAAHASGIYRATWNGSSFDTPVPVAELNADVISFGVVTPDDRTIYYGSSGPGGDLQSLHHLWMATRESTSAPFSAPTYVADLNSLDKEQDPSFVSRDGCTLYFCTYAFDQNHTGFFTEYVAEKPAK
jgi:WD40 repeat protein